MKTKNFLLGGLLLGSLNVLAQTQNNTTVVSNSPCTTFSLKADKGKDLKDFDWNMVPKVFEHNDKDQIVTLAFEMVDNLDKDKSKVKKVACKVTGKTSDLAKLTILFRKQVTELSNSTSEDN